MSVYVCGDRLKYVGKPPLTIRSKTKGFTCIPKNPSYTCMMYIEDIFDFHASKINISSSFTNCTDPSIFVAQWFWRKPFILPWGNLPRLVQGSGLCIRWNCPSDATKTMSPVAFHGTWRRSKGVGSSVASEAWGPLWHFDKNSLDIWSVYTVLS